MSPTKYMSISHSFRSPLSATGTGMWLLLLVGAALNPTVPGNALGATRSEKRAAKIQAKEDRLYFTIPTDERGQQKLLKRWSKKFRIKFRAEAADVPDKGELMRAVKAWVTVENKSDWPMSFLTNRDKVKDIGLLDAGEKRKETLVVDLYVQRNIRIDLGEFGKGWGVVTTKKTPIFFKFASPTGRTMWFEAELTVHVQTPRPNPKLSLKIRPEGQPKREDIMKVRR